MYCYLVRLFKVAIFKVGQQILNGLDYEFSFLPKVFKIGHCSVVAKGLKISQKINGVQSLNYFFALV
jgi:hypothetical protein